MANLFPTTNVETANSARLSPPNSGPRSVTFTAKVIGDDPPSDKRWPVAAKGNDLTVNTSVIADFQPSIKRDFKDAGQYPASILANSPSTSPPPNSKNPPMLMVVTKWLYDALSRVHSGLTYVSLRMTLGPHPAPILFCVWIGLIGSAHAAAVEQSPKTPAREHKTCDIILPILFSFLFIASLVALWWVHRRAAARHAADRGTQTHHIPITPPSIPDPIHLQSTRSAPLFSASQVILNLTNALTATPRGNLQWGNPEIVFAGLSVLLTFIALVISGLSYLDAHRVRSHT